MCGGGRRGKGEKELNTMVVLASTMINVFK